jgi:hypothetical protein
MTQAAEVSRRDRRGGLDLDSDDVSLTVLQDRVDLNLVFGAVMEQLGALPGPGQLPGQLHQHQGPHLGSAFDVGQLADVARDEIGEVGGMMAAVVVVFWSLVVWCSGR